jgi:hypothetical protein
MRRTSLAKSIVDRLRRIQILLECEHLTAIIQNALLTAAVDTQIREQGNDVLKFPCATYVCNVPDVKCHIARSLQNYHRGAASPINIHNGLNAEPVSVRKAGSGFGKVTCRKIDPPVLTHSTLRVPLQFNTPVKKASTAFQFSKIEIITPTAVIKVPINSGGKLRLIGSGSLTVNSVPPNIESKIPLIKSREPGPARDALAHHVTWIEEKKLLAAAACGDFTEQDVQILGIYRHVPLSSAARIEMGPGPGKLSLYFRPIKGNMVQSSNRPIYSIAFGRVRGRQDVLRVLIPE